MEWKNTMADNLRQHLGIHNVWISEEHRIASFHPVEGYVVQTFSNHDFFMSYIHSLQERNFRFQ